jgi:hypothetical protein
MMGLNKGNILALIGILSIFAAWQQSIALDGILKGFVDNNEQGLHLHLSTFASASIQRKAGEDR